MSEIGEIISPPVAHKEPDEKCPFCPPAKQGDYKTYPGAKNNSKKLASIMKDPSKLVSLQENARPQTGKSDSDGYTIEQSVLEARLEDETTSYTHQAHHLISGKQALQGSPIEDWLVGGAKIEKDTGYSVNSTGNGFWAPSVPKEYVNRWGPSKNVLTDEQRQEEAELVMAAANAQAHIGPHNISDPDDPDGEKHETYDQYIKDKLEEVSEHIKAWATGCGFCDAEKGKPQTTYRVNDVMDRLSDHLEGEVSGPREGWRIFLSKYARDYHKPVCSHGGEEV